MLWFGKKKGKITLTAKEVKKEIENMYKRTKYPVNARKLFTNGAGKHIDKDGLKFCMDATNWVAKHEGFAMIGMVYDKSLSTGMQFGGGNAELMVRMAFEIYKDSKKRLAQMGRGFREEGEEFYDLEK